MFLGEVEKERLGVISGNPDWLRTKGYFSEGSNDLFGTFQFHQQQHVTFVEDGFHGRRLNAGKLIQFEG